MGRVALLGGRLACMTSFLGRSNSLSLSRRIKVGAVIGSVGRVIKSHANLNLDLCWFY